MKNINTMIKNLQKGIKTSKVVKILTQYFNKFAKFAHIKPKQLMILLGLFLVCILTLGLGMNKGYKEGLTMNELEEETKTIIDDMNKAINDVIVDDIKKTSFKNAVNDYISNKFQILNNPNYTTVSDIDETITINVAKQTELDTLKQPILDEIALHSNNLQQILENAFFALDEQVIKNFKSITIPNYLDPSVNAPTTSTYVQISNNILDQGHSADDATSTDSTSTDATSTDATSTDATKPVHCVGSWSEIDTCDNGIIKKKYTVTTSASNGGSPCEYAHNELRSFHCEKTEPDIPESITNPQLLLDYINKIDTDFANADKWKQLYVAELKRRNEYIKYANAHNNQYHSNGATTSQQTQGTQQYDSLTGNGKAGVPPGDEDLYMLKSRMVPPTNPPGSGMQSENGGNGNGNGNNIQEPTNTNGCCKPAPVPPCPPCERCPEPAFDCKRVPNYNSVTSNQYLPRPVLTDFSQFGM